MLSELKPVAERHKLSLTQLVIAWTASQPGLTHVLCGARTPEQAIENAAAGSVELPPEELEAINQIVRARKLAGEIVVESSRMVSLRHRDREPDQR